jgi:hypothetical protein
MGEFSYQGVLAVTGTVLATGNADKSLTLTKVVNLRFNNPAAYILQLYKYEALTATTSLIYELTLDAGDTVTDSLAYALNPGDTMTAYSNIVGTTYYVYGINY